jgi:hypothetical protein
VVTGDRGDESAESMHELVPRELAVPSGQADERRGVDRLERSAPVADTSDGEARPPCTGDLCERPFLRHEPGSSLADRTALTLSVVAHTSITAGQPVDPGFVRVPYAAGQRQR